MIRTTPASISRGMAVPLPPETSRRVSMQMASKSPEEGRWPPRVQRRGMKGTGGCIVLSIW